jgi:SAM-dependent methyltransferase
MMDAATFTGTIPIDYDKCLGPMIFVDYAADIAQRAAHHHPARVLETAAGTGIVTRALRDLLPAGATLTATDLSAAMLAIARRKFRAEEGVDFQPADATALPFADASFDTVVCQFGLMFFPDRDQSIREVYRVLAPGGRYLFSVWDSLRHNSFGRIAHATVASLFRTHAPSFLDVPFSCHSIDPLKEALIASGFTDVAIAVVGREKEISAATLGRGLVYGSPLVDQIPARGNVTPDRVADAITQALQRELGAEPRRMRLQAIVFSASKPS